MVSNYYLTVKKYLDENKIDYSLPDYIQRGWHRIYTPEEQVLNARSTIIGPDVQIPNSVVRRRLGARQMLIKENVQNLRKAFELPDELLVNLSQEHKVSGMIVEDKLSPKWEDDDSDNETKYKRSPMDKIIRKMRDKRRRYEENKFDDYNNEALSIDEIIEEIRTNIGKTLKPNDIKLIRDLMQTISQHKQTQVIDVYNQLTDIQLIHQFGGIPKLVQALEDIQKAFEQVAMKTNIPSIETVINLLLEKDNTYRVAMELLKSFNENTKHNKQRKILELHDKFGDISDYDQTVFQILKTDVINRLSTSDITILMDDLDANNVSNNRDDQIKLITEQLNSIFNRAHLDGIKAMFQMLKSSVSIMLKNSIDKIEKSLTNKLTERDSIIIESYIHDHLTSLTKNELKTVYERLAQQGTLKRMTITDDLNQTITMSLMKKINTNGLGSVIENIKHAQLDIDSIRRLTETLTDVNAYTETRSPVSLDQIQNQLGMAYFIEIRNLSKQDIHALCKAADLYSIVHIQLNEESTPDQYSDFLEHLKAPFIRICSERIFNLITHDSTINLNDVSGKFYNQRVADLLNELIHGSDEMNRNLILQKIKKQINKDKGLLDKIYRQMLKEKLIPIDTKSKNETEKKKVSKIMHKINQILTNADDRIKQEQSVALLERMDIAIPESVKRWYKNKLDTKNKQYSASNRKKNTDKSMGLLRKNVKDQLKTTAAAAEINDSTDGLKFQSDISQLPITTDLLISNTINTSVEVEPSKNSSASDTTLNTIQKLSSIDNEQMMMIPLEMKAEYQETYFEENNELSMPRKADIYKTVNIESSPDTAVLFYPSSPFIADPQREIHTNIYSTTAELINDPEYSKIKAQRMVAKTPPTSIVLQPIEQVTVDLTTSPTNLPTNSTAAETRKLSDSPIEPLNESTTPPKSTTKRHRRTVTKSTRKSEDIYRNSLTTALHTLFAQSEYHAIKLQKIHQELIASSHISPLNEFYRSSNDALRVTLDHSSTYADLIKWTLSLLETSNKPNLIDFGHDLYAIAINLDLTLIEHIDITKCAVDVRQNLQHILQKIPEEDLREINSYMNASQLEKLFRLTKKLNVTSKERMISDLNLLLLHFIQYCHTFESKYRPMQMRIREIAERFKSRAVSDLVHGIDEIEKNLAKNFSITFFGLSKRVNDSQFVLIK